MQCTDFLSWYSDFRDGLIADQALLRHLERHLKSCRRCALYDRTVSSGVSTLRTLEEIEPSLAFRRELRARLAAAVRGAGERSNGLTPAGYAAAVLLAVAGALLLYEGTGGRAREAELAGVLPPAPVVVVNPGVPFVSFTAAGRERSATLVMPASAHRPGVDWGTIAP